MSIKSQLINEVKIFKKESVYFNIMQCHGVPQGTVTVCYNGEWV